MKASVIWSSPIPSGTKPGVLACGTRRPRTTCSSPRESQAVVEREVIAHRCPERPPQGTPGGRPRSSLCRAVPGLSSETSPHRTWSSAQHWWTPFMALRRLRHKARREAPPRQRRLQRPRRETEGGQLLMVTNAKTLLRGIFNKFTTVILSLAVYPSGQYIDPNHFSDNRRARLDLFANCIQPSLAA